MTRVRNEVRGVWALGLLLTLGGCSTLVDRPIAYQEARETPPLEVPEDLVRPAANPALQIPAVAGVAPAVDSAPPSVGNTVAVARAGLPRAANAVLSLADEPGSAWRRVGIALERSGCCKVVAKDEAGMAYQVQLNGAAPKPGFFKRIFGGSAPASTMTLKVASADSGATVSVVDEAGELRRDDAAMTVLGVVESRLR